VKTIPQSKLSVNPVIYVRIIRGILSNSDKYLTKHRSDRRRRAVFKCAAENRPIGLIKNKINLFF